MCKHPAYGQSLLKIGFPLNDPIVELGAVWARGDAASSRLVNQALISAERWRENRDKLRARIAGNLVPKLKTYAEEARRYEARHHMPKYSERSLTGARNPGRRIRPSKSKPSAYSPEEIAFIRKWAHHYENAFEGYKDDPELAAAGKRMYKLRERTRDEMIDIMNDEIRSSKKKRGKRFNPGRGRYREDRYYAEREMRSAKRAKRSKYRRHASKAGMQAMLGRMNPYARPNENEIETVRYPRPPQHNPPISHSEAKALQAVLARHGYACNPVLTNPYRGGEHRGGFRGGRFGGGSRFGGGRRWGRRY